MARYLLSVKDNKTKKRKYSLSDVCDVQSYAFGFKHLTTVNDWVTARAFFKAENPDLPDHFYEQYMPLYPRWGSACNEPGDVRSTQGLEKTWEHTKKKKKHHQKVNKNAKEIESIFESLSQREEQHVGSQFMFAVEPTIPKDAWDAIGSHHNTNARSDLMSAPYYSLADARALTRQEAIGNAHRNGGYVVYFLHENFANECKEKAINASFGFDGSSGMTLQQIQMQQQQSKDRKCISTKPMPVKVAYMKLIGNGLQSNTPSKLEGEECHSFIRRRAQRILSAREMTHSSKKKSPKKGTREYDAHQRELENKK
jgi:hypothetical protein